MTARLHSALDSEVARPGHTAWADTAAEALAWLGIDGARVVGHLEPRDGVVVARAPDGTPVGILADDASSTHPPALVALDLLLTLSDPPRAAA